MKSQANRELYEMAVRAMVDRQTQRNAREYNLDAPSHAYSAGYLGSMVVSMLADLPAAKRNFYLKQILEAK
jgi:hypothetical protein